jgi:hypothetical protein
MATRVIHTKDVAIVQRAMDAFRNIAKIALADIGIASSAPGPKQGDVLSIRQLEDEWHHYRVNTTSPEMRKCGAATKKDLAGVERGIDDKNNPLFVDTLHNYVHNRFYSPTERDLKVAWDNSQLFFTTIWR